MGLERTLRSNLLFPVGKGNPEGVQRLYGEDFVSNLDQLVQHSISRTFVKDGGPINLKSGGRDELFIKTRFCK